MNPSNGGRPLVEILSRLSAESRRALLDALLRHGNRELTERLREIPGDDIADTYRQLVHQQAPRLYVRSFGSLAVHRGGWHGPLVHVRKRRLRSLLAVLVAHAGQTLTRDMVLDLLWPDSDPAAAVNNLNQTVFQLRRLLDPGYRDGRSPAYLISNSETVQFNSDLVRTDLHEFRRLAHRRSGSTFGTASGAEDALDLIRGEFLSDVRYEDWAWTLATVVHNEVRTLLMPVAAGKTRLDNQELGVRAACALLTLDPLDEWAQIAVAEQLAASGRRAAGRESLIQFARRAREELDEDPSEALIAALERVGVKPQVQKELTRPTNSPARA